ncbi:hypothetical protein [Sphaerisporangium dianthi]|uniref:Uncharacterized protein n=1 Tax=Sphaerisporangium dianthi TaxID=1436120 RepID=A0ABV9CI40_9ACTN
MRKGTTAISVGALTLALAGGTALLVATPAAGSSAGADGCGRGALVLSGLTGKVCDLLGEVGNAIGDPGGDGLEPVTDTVTDVADDALEPVTDTVTDLADNALEPVTDTVTDLADNALKPVTDTVTDLADDALKPVKDSVEDLGDDALKPVKDSVEDLGDERLKPVTDRGEKTTGKRAGGPSPTAEPASPGTPSATASQSPAVPRDVSGGDLLELDAGCLPLVGSGDCGGSDRSEIPPASKPPAGTDRSTPSPPPSAPPDVRPGETGEAPSDGLAPEEESLPPGGAGAGLPVDRATPQARVPEPPSADVEAPPVVTLWPGLPLPSLAGDPRARTAVPSKPYDVVGTVLTAVLLASAILAARIVQSRRDADAPRSMPFDGMRPSDAGRHRLA